MRGDQKMDEQGSNLGLNVSYAIYLKPLHLSVTLLH